MRPGWKTTEFWLALAGKVATVAGVVAHVVPGGIGAAVVGAIGVAYTIGRAITKSASTSPGPTPPIAGVTGG